MEHRRHAAEYEAGRARRALTSAELQALFDHADDQVVAARAGGPKGWLTAMRDAAALKIAYAMGLRRREAVMFDRATSARNAHAAEFGRHGVLYVRWGKATRAAHPSGAAC